MNTMRVIRIIRGIAVILGFFLAVLGIAQQIKGFDIWDAFNEPRNVWAIVLAFIILCAWWITELLKENKELKGLQPKVEIRSAYIDVDVKTTDFVYTSDDDSSQVRRSGGTLDVYAYKEVLRDEYGSTDNIEALSTYQSYALVDFVNNKDGKDNVRDAKNVKARLGFYKDGKRIIDVDIKGRWAQLPERIFWRSAAEGLYVLGSVDIPANADERTLAIAVKKREEKDCFAMGMESYEDAEFLKKDELRLGVGRFEVEVELQGSPLSQTKYSFLLENPGEGKDISINEA